MSIHLILDSCCDLTPDLMERLQPSVAPLSVRLTNGKEYIDDGTVNVSAMLADMEATRQGGSSACPPPDSFAVPMREHEACFVVTLSSKLSGSYNAACMAADMVREEFPDKKIHVFDSESASAGEVQIALLLHEKIEEGLSFEEIIPLADALITEMRTLFVLEDLGNFIRNGRLNKVSGFIATALSLCPIMSDNGHGDIQLAAKVRGIQNSLRRLVDLVAEATEQAAGRSLRLVMGFCNCPERAAALKAALMERCSALREVILVPTGALSSLYANNGGVVIAFPTVRAY